MSRRVAIYFTPAAGTPLAEFGAGWLGRDIRCERDNPRLLVDGIDPVCQEAITDSPRRYGFHGTLKAPFALAADHSLADLHGRWPTLSPGGRSWRCRLLI